LSKTEVMSLQLAIHIQELIKTHRCVIIPGFGGFVSNYKPAGIDNTTDVFTPPSYEIAFNPTLTHNDGLLLEKLSKENNISIDQAEEQLNRQIAALRRELYSHGSVELEGLGLFYIDKNQKIAFRSALKANLNLQSFGLKSFRLPSLKNRRQMQTYEQQIMEAGKNRRVIISSAAAAVITVFVVLMITVNQLRKAEGVNEAGVLPSTEQSIVHDSKTSQISSGTELSTGKRQALYYSGEQDLSEYHIIAGSYNSKTAAEKYALGLMHEGLHVQILEDTQKFRISIFSTTDKYEALRQLDFYRLTINRDLWLLKKSQE